jgi:hypothetical protein
MPLKFRRELFEVVSGEGRNRDDVVACLTQSVNYRSRTALVGQKIHVSGLMPNRSVRE